MAKVCSSLNYLVVNLSLLFVIESVSSLKHNEISAILNGFVYGFLYLVMPPAHHEIQAFMCVSSSSTSHPTSYKAFLLFTSGIPMLCNLLIRTNTCPLWMWSNHYSILSLALFGFGVCVSSKIPFSIIFNTVQMLNSA